MNVTPENESPRSKACEEVKLTGVPETLLIPLWARAAEGQMAKPIVVDEKAAEIVGRIEYDFSRFEKARFSQVGVAVRTLLLDEGTERFLREHPDGCVINLGAGLDTRRARLGCPREALWYELDLREPLELLRRFFEETESYRFLEASVFDHGWFDQVETEGRAVLLIAEGLLVYFEEEQVRELFARLADRFAGAEMLVEVQGPGIVGQARRHDSVNKTGDVPEFKWGTADSRDITRWHPGIEILEERRFFDRHLDRAGLLGLLMRLPFLRKKYEPRIVRLRFNT